MDVHSIYVYMCVYTYILHYLNYHELPYNHMYCRRTLVKPILGFTSRPIDVLCPWVASEKRGLISAYQIID